MDTYVACVVLFLNLTQIISDTTKTWSKQHNTTGSIVYKCTEYTKYKCRLQICNTEVIIKDSSCCELSLHCLLDYSVRKLRSKGIKDLVMETTGLTQIPPRLLNMTYLQKIVISGNKIETFNTLSNTAQYHNLTHLYLANNSAVFIDSTFFQSYTNLQKIHLEDNTIQIVPNYKPLICIITTYICWIMLSFVSSQLYEWKYWWIKIIYILDHQTRNPLNVTTLSG